MHGTRYVVIFLIVLTVNLSEIYGVAISPKLDFPEKSGIVEVREIKDGRIKGLRVTVDTSELKESKSSGSESSASSDSSSEKKKTVGVRTDVTFEITSGETNDTKTVEVGKDDDNASIPVVPVFKGTPDRGGSVNGKNTDSSYNEILSVLPLESTSAPPVNIFNNPQHPQQHHGYQNPSRRPIHPSYPNPQHHGHQNRYGGDEMNDRSDGWNVLYPQYEIWTTERNSHRRFDQPPSAFHPSSEGQFGIFKKPSSFVPYQIHHDHRHLSSHHHRPPCNCKEYPGPQIVGVSNVQPLHPTLTDEFKHTNKIDDKLERPFSKSLKK